MIPVQNPTDFKHQAPSPCAVKGTSVVFQNKLVAAIKVNGQVLRETDNTVAIPFGSEYSILVKNLNAVRAQVKVSVDGADATSGTWLVIAANASLELERFIRHGNWEAGNRFKFIERTKEIEGHRGIQADDGIVRVEYQIERVRPIVDIPIPRYYEVPRPYYPPYPPRPRWFGPGMRRPMRPTVSASIGARSLRPMSRPSASAGPRRPPIMDSARLRNDVGITVPGSRSDQRFVEAEWFETTGQSEVLILHLRGAIGGKVVVRPITIKAKLTCQTCGKTSKPGADYCPDCGTALSLI
jgi:hypothetical protein